MPKLERTCTIESWSERKEKGAAVQGIGAFASKYQPQPFEGEEDKWREWAGVFRSWSGYAHRNDSATILNLAHVIEV